VFASGQSARLWRVVSGVLRLVQRERDAQHLMSLALPGDLLGIEALCNMPHQLSAEALTDVVLAPVEPQNETERQQLMVLALLQQQQRSHDMAQLRTGPVLPRVATLLKMLGHASALVGQPQDTDALRSSLPPLRELALVVDAKSETVCRALAQLLPPRTRKSGPRPWAAAGAAAGAVASASARAAAQALGIVAQPSLDMDGALA
jgi:CRP-like cAMP-binding protein